MLLTDQGRPHGPRGPSLGYGNPQPKAEAQADSPTIYLQVTHVEGSLQGREASHANHP